MARGRLIGPAVLAFHKVCDSLTFSSTNYPPRRLARLLEILRTESVDPAGERLSATDWPPDITLTFDDAYSHLAESLPPLVERFRFRPLILVPTAYIGRFNRWDYSYRLRPLRHLNRAGIRRLAEGGARFGSHGHSHVDLTAVETDRLNNELLFSKAMLEDLTGRPVKSISYPFGRCDSRVLEATEAAGFERGYTMRFPTPGDLPLAQGRMAVYGYDTPLSIWLKLHGGVWGNIESSKSGITNRLSGGTVLLNRVRRVRAD